MWRADTYRDRIGEGVFRLATTGQVAALRKGFREAKPTLGNHGVNPMQGKLLTCSRSSDRPAQNK